MSDSPQKPTQNSKRLTELMVTSILQKHGITKESIKGKLSEEQKKTFIELLEELNRQADELVAKQATTKKYSN